MNQESIRIVRVILVFEGSNEMKKCESCDSTTVNGVYVHEAGCSDSWKNGVWECQSCGVGFLPEWRE